MRILGKEPKNADALIKAGELTLKLGDPTAAAVLFSRAEAERPHDGHLKADEAAVLVHMERPGEALRLFQQAESMGADMADFASERGLAYDLIGQQERAQRDYRTALAQNPDNAETMRRYALSLGISGQRDRALAEIDPLVRQQDHAGWRDRAFILAMTGDPDQADKIAKAMLSPQMAVGLAPFFQRLPQLSPVDRAFAVHFGEVASTPQRVADARLVPPLPPLAPEPVSPPVEVAAAKPAKESRAQRRAREKAERRQASVAQSARQESSTAGVAAKAAPTPAPTPAQLAATAPVAPAPSSAQSQATSPAPAEAAVAHQAASTPPPPKAAPTPAKAAPPVKAATRVGQEDDILHQIMSGISVPPSETGSAPSEPAAAPPPAATKPVPDPAAEAKRLEAANLAAVKKAAEERAEAEAERKAAAAKKAAEAKKAADAKAAAEKAAKEKEEKANPSRIWVQVAGGANEHDLPKAWAALKAKAPDAFKGKQGWSTPLNATNRVLAGPFKSDDAAQDFVNQLAKKGLSAFPFTSAKGQKIDKLPAK
ncbi:tetratricopeptide repeat protein [Hephaestia mangrovi]|uniref:tetratricopeptide repeat protein n=1 Tax=Hephaestia mangrovi TaxID=2873268 RepID=UPI0021053EA6|nr:tetratricopeptide repeat protein [Hephaestia mangrovi]